MQGQVGGVEPSEAGEEENQKKTAPVYAEVVLRMEPLVARSNKRQKRGRMMAKSDMVRREKKRTAPDGRSFECRHCGGSFSAEKHVYSCGKAPWAEWAKGVKWRADLRNKRFTAEEMDTWQHRCVHCEVSFPCKSGLTRHASECRKRRAREGLSL